MEIKTIEYGSMAASDISAREPWRVGRFVSRTICRSKQGFHLYNLLNGLTECNDIDHGNRYVDNAYFGIKFKAFRNLRAEWQAWLQVKISQGEVMSGGDHP